MRTPNGQWLSAWIVTVAMVSAGVRYAEGQTRVSEQKLRFQTLDDPSALQEAWYAGQTTDTLYVVSVTSQAGQPKAVPFDRITMLERYQGMKSHTLQGMRVGLVVAAIPLLALWIPECLRGDIGDETGCSGLGVVLFGVPAVALGGIIGALHRTERWEKVPTPPVPVQVGFLPGSRIGVGLSFRM